MPGNTGKGWEFQVKAEKVYKNIRKIAGRNMVRNEDIKKQCKQHGLVKVNVLKQLSKMKHRHMSPQNVQQF
jgi:hypothetical protein